MRRFHSSNDVNETRTWPLFELPVLVKESGVDDFSGAVGTGLFGKIDDGPVGEFGDLAGVVEVVEFTVGKAAVENDIVQWVERVGVDHDERMIVSVIGLGTDGDFLGIPLDGKFRHDSRKEGVRGGISP